MDKLDFVKLELSDLNDLVNCIKGNDFRVTKSPHNQVKDEFNKFVKREISERRKNSSITSLRTFHNEIKRVLIENVSRLFNFVNLLDIAVGRGGDISKWKSAGIKNVFGFDKSRDSIESINPFNQGARERLRNFKDIKVNVKFETGDAIQPSKELMESISSFMKINEIKAFEILSCQFAVHYFFQSETALRNVFNTFSPLVKQGGYFIGTTVDGKKIIELLQRESRFDSPLLNITKKYDRL